MGVGQLGGVVVVFGKGEGLVQVPDRLLVPPQEGVGVAEVVVGVGVGGASAQSALLTTLVSRVTAASWASSRPKTFTPVVAVMEV